MSFLASVKAAANAAVDKSKQFVEHMKAPPASIKCSNDACPYEVMVPPTAFNWPCPKCTLLNDRQLTACSGCNTPVPDSLTNPKVQCTMCQTWTEVPRSNAKKNLDSAVSSTKKFAVAAKVAAEQKYQHLKAAPDKFTCNNCGTELVNPNPPDDAPAGVKQQNPRIDVVVCSICHQHTGVPGSNFAKSMRANTQIIAKTATRAYLSVADKKHADCPICKNPVVVPADLLSAINAAPSAAPPPAAAAPGGPVVAAAVPSASAGPPSVVVELTCEKCKNSFPAKI